MLIRIALLLLLAMAAEVTAQERQPVERPTARATRLAQGPQIDGQVIDDPTWKSVTPVTGFWQTSPDAGQPVSERTEVRIAYTADTIYFGIVCFDSSPDGLTVTDARRDSSMAESDSFRIVLDTYHDSQNGFVFGTNPVGQEYDGQVTNEGLGSGTNPGGGSAQAGSGGGFNLNWDGSWQVRSAISEHGWSAEFAIPFRTLRYAAGSAQTWGLNMERGIRRRKETAFWAPLPIQFDLLRVSVAGMLTGLDLAAPRNLKVIPYGLGEARDRGLRTDGALLGDAGLDVKYGITPSLTLDASYNTDFAQVEVDDQQINLDRFNLFFPEKRPFFLENAGLFSVGRPAEVEVFFSRRIGIDDDGSAIPIVGGARLSGRAGPVNVGLLNMQTESVPGRAADNFTVARVRRDFANRSNLGVIFVGRQATGDRAGTGDHNGAFAVDGRLGIGRTALVNGFAARTATPGVSSGQHAYHIEARNETQLLTVSGGLTETGRHFNPEVGFLSRTGGFRRMDLATQARIRPRALRAFQELRPHSSFRSYWNPDGFQESMHWHIDQHWELKNSYEFHTGFNVTREGVVRPFEIYPGVIVPPGTYDHREAQLVFFTNEGAPVSGRIQVVAGGWFGGNRVQLTPSLALRAGDRLTASLSLSRNDFDLPGGSFVTNLIRSRLSYSFSARVFVQSLIQYNDRADIWSSNFRFGWLQQANTGVFIVYTDTHPFDDPIIAPRGTDRSLIVKISRMFDVLN